MAGKGDRQRPTDHVKFSQNYDRIFGDKKTRREASKPRKGKS